MLVFIDDSGDPGFKLDKGSSAVFVIALVIFDDELEAEKTAVAVKELRRSLGFAEHEEFKFFKSRSEVREKFLRAVAPFKFKVRALVVDKKKIYSPLLKRDKNSFYGYMIKTVLKHGLLKDARIKIDGSGDRVFRRNFLTYLRKELNSEDRHALEHCKLVDSEGNVLIQMADMIAGTIRRSYDVLKTDGPVLKKIIRKHIEDEWLFE